MIHNIPAGTYDFDPINLRLAPPDGWLRVTPLGNGFVGMRFFNVEYPPPRPPESAWISQWHMLTGEGDDTPV